jgi:L-alanine-DL-glutamate epimerase-like enolase superfamily enzyme
MTDPLEIVSIGVATVDVELPVPVVFGNWVMRSREFAIVRLRLKSGHEGWSYTLTRDGAIATQIRRFLSPIYLGTSVADREAVFQLAKRRSLASYSSGIGLRALSILDLASWDAAAKVEELSITSMLGGSSSSMPAVAIIGYPPSRMGPEEIFDQTKDLYENGWRRFKAPVAGTDTLTAERLQAARRAAPDAWIGCDGAWIYDDVETAVRFAHSVEELELGCFEDVFPPGNAKLVRELRDRTSIPIAMGDEQGGSYYPDALLALDAVDIVRVDLTCMGGITGGKEVVRKCIDAGVSFSPHMFPHVHSQVFSGWGFTDAPIEWGAPGSGVHPMDDGLPGPVIGPDGRMAPLNAEPGFGQLVDFEWIRSQRYDDPDGILVTT